jgi:fermentation-respiration switch protein FrsA (DUF1100 family)
MKRKITFERDGVTLAGDLFAPADFDESGHYQAVIVQGSFTSVKEQMAGTYAEKFAEQGFVALSFDYAHYGESAGQPRQLEGREEIMDWISAGWEARLLNYEQYRTVSVHDTADPGTIVVEQEAIGTSKATGAFTLPNIVVLTVRDGQITCFRDYVNIPAAIAALGLAVQ